MNILEESDDEKFECQVVVMLPSRTPVVGFEINPNVRVAGNHGSFHLQFSILPGIGKRLVLILAKIGLVVLSTVTSWPLYNALRV